MMFVDGVAYMSSAYLSYRLGEGSNRHAHAIRGAQVHMNVPGLSCSLS